VQSVLTDPEKMRLGLEQFASNPLLKVRLRLRVGVRGRGRVRVRG